MFNPKGTLVPIDQEALNSTFLPPPATYTPSKHTKPSVVSQSQQTQQQAQTKAQLMERVYAQRQLQTRQQTQRCLIEEDLRQQQRFRETKLKLIQGNETIIRDVDALLHTQAQEKQLAKEKTFIDYEINTFVPIHAKLQNEVDQKFTKEFETQKYIEHINYVKVSKEKGQNLENIDENKYDPFQTKKIATTVVFDDPMYRLQKVKKTEDLIGTNIDNLICEQKITFKSDGRTLQELRNGAHKMEPIKPPQQRDILDPSKWNQIENIIVIPNVNHPKKQFPEKQVLRNPIYIPEDQ
ncbi:hypothetical protein SS50377_20936 [Spironucleus salmonicida]|uniref:Uncharacterized protein n=1 Tax=Spironucleus salmonicida TaxID=348837 RepID=V6LS51_9EUKA|nr:hypothetical protein SS50377_20936 [Spironucleus salmonicida]|eukprot:EST43609.1 hypothetical protein SS50377_16651 [Spironucleus salmonicida]